MHLLQFLFERISYSFIQLQYAPSKLTISGQFYLWQMLKFLSEYINWQLHLQITKSSIAPKLSELRKIIGKLFPLRKIPNNWEDEWKLLTKNEETWLLPLNHYNHNFAPPSITLVAPLNSVRIYYTSQQVHKWCVISNNKAGFFAKLRQMLIKTVAK